MKYFKLSRLYYSWTAKKHGINNIPTESHKKNLVVLVDNVLDPMREHVGVPLIASSGYRCLLLNKKVGGAKDSQHQYGYAADIVGKTDLFELFKWAAKNLQYDQLIYEVKKRKDGSIRVWIHVSYVSLSVNRNQAMTYIDRAYKTYKV